MKAIAALLLLLVGAGSVWAYGMMGGGMMGRSSDAQGFWAYMASMHNWMHGTNYTTNQFRSAMMDPDYAPRDADVGPGMMDWGSDVMMGGCGNAR